MTLGLKANHKQMVDAANVYIHCCWRDQYFLLQSNYKALRTGKTYTHTHTNSVFEQCVVD